MSESAVELIRMARQAQVMLKDLLRELNVPEDDAWPWPPDGPFMTCGHKRLDRLLCDSRLPQGLTVELCGPDVAAVMRFAASWTGAIQQGGAYAACLDPFGECSVAGAGPFVRDKTLMVELTDPHRLAQAAVDLMRRKVISALVIPPGVVEQRFLLEDAAGRYKSEQGLQYGFEKALQAIAYLAERRKIAVFILRHRPSGAMARSLGVANCRLDLLPTDDGLQVRVDHNGLRLQSVGKRIRLNAPAG